MKYCKCLLAFSLCLPFACGFADCPPASSITIAEANGGGIITYTFFQAPRALQVFARLFEPSSIQPQ